MRLGVSFGGASDSLLAGPPISASTSRRPGAGRLGTLTSTSPRPPPPAYVLRQRMVKEGVAWFAQIHKTNVTVGAPSRRWRPATAPARRPAWSGGQTQTYADHPHQHRQPVLERGRTQPRAAGRRLRHQQRQSRRGLGHRSALQPARRPGAGRLGHHQHQVTAPAGAGSYVLRQRMVKEGVAWFAQIQRRRT